MDVGENGPFTGIGTEDLCGIELERSEAAAVLIVEAPVVSGGGEIAISQRMGWVEVFNEIDVEVEDSRTDGGQESTDSDEHSFSLRHLK